MHNQYEKIRDAVSVRWEASAELAISLATLYAYVSRGLIRSEPSANSRSRRYRAEDVRALKERRAPSSEPQRLSSFDAELPVLDSRSRPSPQTARSTGASAVSRLAETRHAGAHARRCYGSHDVDPFSPDDCPRMSDEMHEVAERRKPYHADRPHDRRDWRWPPVPIRARSPAAPDGRALVGGRIMRLVVADHAQRRAIGRAAPLQIARGGRPKNRHARRFDPPCAGAAGRSRTERVDLHGAMRGIDRAEPVQLGHRRARRVEGPEAWRRRELAAQLVKALVDGEVAPMIRERVALGERFAGFGHGRLPARAIRARARCWTP